METLETLYDAYVTETTYQYNLREGGKQNAANLKSSYETMVQIVAELFSLIDNINTLDDQISAAAEAYAESK